MATMLEDLSAQLTQEVAQLQAAITANDDAAITATADALVITAQSIDAAVKRVGETAPSSELGTEPGPPPIYPPPVGSAPPPTE